MYEFTHRHRGQHAAQHHPAGNLTTPWHTLAKTHPNTHVSPRTATRVVVSMPRSTTPLAPSPMTSVRYSSDSSQSSGEAAGEVEAEAPPLCAGAKYGTVARAAVTSAGGEDGACASAR